LLLFVQGVVHDFPVVGGMGRPASFYGKSVLVALQKLSAAFVKNTCHKRIFRGAAVIHGS